jgi:hypothetical protein
LQCRQTKTVSVLFRKVPTKNIKKNKARHLTFDKGAQNMSWRKGSFFNRSNIISFFFMAE